MQLEWSKADIKEFNEKGYLHLKGVVDSKRCDAIKEIAKTHLKYRVPPFELESEYIGIDNEIYSKTIRRLRQVYDRDILFKEWIEEPTIRPLLAHLLDSKPIFVKAHHNSIMTKMPRKNSTHTHWHRDLRYWSYQNDNLLSVWLALGYEDRNNGVLEFIPTSHRVEFVSEAFDEKEFFRDDYAPNKVWIAKKESLVLEKGDIVLFHCKLLHQAGANESDSTKFSFVYTVRSKDNLPIRGSHSSAFDEVPLPLETI